MPVDLLAAQEPVAQGRDLLAGADAASNDTPSWRQGAAPTMWDKMNEWFAGDVKAQSAKATNALVYSEMLGISPDTAYTYHDEISKQIQDKLAGEDIVTSRVGIPGALSSGVQSSLAGMMAKQKVPAPFESVSQMERWIQGMTSMGLDLPFFLTGYAMGGGTPITGTAGAFGFTGGLRQMLIDRYSKGEVKSFGELLDRTKSAAIKTIQGQAVGAATGLAGGLSSATGLKLATELATMTTAGRLVEGQLPTVQDFIDNAGMLLIMHYGQKGYKEGKARIPEIRAKLQDAFVDFGAHPKAISEMIANKPTQSSDPAVDLADVLTQASNEIKATVPAENPEKVSTETRPAEEQIARIEPTGEGINEPTPAGQGAKVELASKEIAPPQETGPTDIRNATVDAEREARGLPPIETPVTERPADWRKTVEAKVDSGEIDPQTIANKINNLVDMGERPPVLSDEGNHALLYGKKQLQNEHKIVENAIEQGDAAKQDTTELQQRRDEIEAALDANEKATKATGTEQGRALQSRQDQMNEDYSFSAMIQRAKNDGITITPEVRTKLKGLSNRIEKAQEAVDSLGEQVVKDSIDKTVKILKEEEGLAQRKEKRTDVKKELDAEFDSLVSAFNKQIGGQLNIGIDPTAVKTLIDMARNRIRAGIVTGEGIIDEIHIAIKKAGIELSKRDIQDAISGYGVTKGMSQEEIAVKLREAKTQMRLLSALEDAKKGEPPLRTGLQRDKQSDRVRELGRQVQEAMRQSGIDSRNAQSPERQWKTSLDAVKTRLVNSITDLSKQIDTREKIAKDKGIKYDEEATALKEFRDGLQKVSEEIFGKKELSDEQRVRQATAAVEKSITEYERRIREGDLAPQKKESKTPETPELKKLREDRDKLKDQLSAMIKERDAKDKGINFPDIKRYESAIKSLKKSIADYEKRIKEQDLSPKKKESFPVLETTELADLRDIRDWFKGTIEEMRKEATPKKTPEEIALQSFRTRTENQIKDFERRLREGDFAQKPKGEPPEKGERELKLKFELDKIKKEYAKAHVEFQLAGRTPLQKIGAGVVEALNLTKALKSSFDVSAVGRQGWLAFISHPVTGAKLIPEMFRAMGSEEQMFRIDQEILQRKNYPLYEKAGLSLTEKGGTLKQMEEQFQSRWAESIPGVSASERAYVSYLNMIRVNLFDSVSKSAFGDGRGTDAELKAIGNYVNEATGRGNIKGYESALTGLGVFLWAPKLVLSRFQMLAGHSMWGGSATTRIAIAKEYGRILGGIGAVYAISSLWDEVSIEESPLSSDYGKIRIGNTRIDVQAGLSQATVLLDRVISGETKKASGSIVSITENTPYGGTTVAGVLGVFLRTKLSPVISTAIDLRQGRDVVGNKVTLWDIPEKMLMPLTFGDIYDAMLQNDIPAGAALSVLSTFGVGVQVYDPAKRN